MKKVFRRFSKWFLLKFRNHVIKKVDFEAFSIVFRRFTMEIKTVSGNFKMVTLGMLHPNASLYNHIENGVTSIPQWYCETMYIIATMLTTDSGFAQDINKAISKYSKRLDKQAESQAKNITEQDEQLSQAVVISNIESLKMTKKQRKEYKKDLRNELTSK